MAIRNYALILFIVVGINAIYSLPQKCNADRAVMREGHDDLYPEVTRPDGNGGGRVKRNKPLTADRVSGITGGRGRQGVLGRGVQGRGERAGNQRFEVFLEHFRITIAVYMQEGDTLALAIRRYENNHADTINRVDH